MSIVSPRKAWTLGIGDRWYVEPADDSERILVETLGPARWSLVNGVMLLTVRRLDTDRIVEVEIHKDAEVHLEETAP